MFKIWCTKWVLVLTAMYTMQASAQKLSGKSLHFDGHNDFVQAPHYDALNTGNGDFTYEARIRASARQIHAYPAIVSDRNKSTENGVIVFLVPGEEAWTMGKPWININGKNYPCGECRILTNASVYALAVVRRQDTIKFYINGVLQQSRNVLPGTGKITTTGDVQIGHDQANPSMTYFRGDIAEVRIWNVARTTEEIAAFYNKTIDGNTPGLTGYWRLDEGAGQTVYNSAQNNSSAGTLGASVLLQSDDPLWAKSATVIKK